MTDTAINRTMGAREWAMLAALGLMWGGSFFFIGVAVRELPPFTIVAARVIIGAAALGLALRLASLALPRAPRAWAAFAGMAVLNNVIPFTLIVWAQHHIPSGLASILNATTPLFTVLVAHVATRDERLDARRTLGILVGFLGVVAMMAPSIAGGIGAVPLLPQLAILGATLSYGVSGVFGRRFKAYGLAPVATAAGQLVMASLMMLPLALLIEQPWQLERPSLPAAASVAALGVISTGIAYLLFFRILASAGATNLSLVTLLVPVSAILLGVTILDERLGLEHIAGMALIAAGFAILDGRPLAALRRRLGLRGAAKS